MIQDTEVLDVQRANSLLENFGLSAFNTKQSGFSVAAGVQGSYSGTGEGASGAASGGYAKSKGSAGGQSDSSYTTDGAKLSANIRTFVKSHYFFEPKLELSIPTSVLMMTLDFKERSRAAAQLLCIDQATANGVDPSTCGATASAAPSANAGTTAAAAAQPAPAPPPQTPFPAPAPKAATYPNVIQAARVVLIEQSPPSQGSSSYTIASSSDPGLTTPIAKKSASTLAIESLIFDYGTHICTNALLGGWWRITASFESITDTTYLQAELVTSHAIEQQRSKSSAVEASASAAYSSPEASGAAAASGASNSGSASDQNSANTKGSNFQAQDSNSTSKTEVFQAWKGGSTGVSASDWRKSLDSSLSSNWKVIDRMVGKCTGIWNFVEDPNLATNLCNVWINLYLSGMGLSASDIDPSVSQAACKNTYHMNLLRSAAVSIMNQKSAAKFAAQKEVCEAGKTFSYYKLTAVRLRDPGNSSTWAVSSPSFQFLGATVSMVNVKFSKVSGKVANKVDFLAGISTFNLSYPTESLLIWWANATSIITPPIDAMTFLLTSDLRSNPIQVTLSGVDAQGNEFLILSSSDPLDALLNQKPLGWLSIAGANGPGCVMDAMQNVCRPKQCWCTSSGGRQLGTSGVSCPSDGALDCNGCCGTSQQQSCQMLGCSTLDINLVNRPGFRLCANGACAASDKATCCQSKYLSSQFQLRVSTDTGGGCGTDGDVYASFQGVNPDTNQVISTAFVNLDSNQDDFEKGSTGNYPVLTPLMMPDKLCLQLKDADDWCCSKVEVYNPNLPSGSSLLSTITGWSRFDSKSSGSMTQCLSLR